MLVKPDEDALEKWKSELKKDIARWNEIYINGCSDPFWPDGTNLNLKRNHIIYDLRHIMELQVEPVQVSLFDMGGRDDVINDDVIPPKVPDDYMAKPRRCNYFDRYGVNAETKGDS